MIRELMHDPMFLSGKSEEATIDDIEVANDLLETLIAHKDSCVGMAANMIGVRKRIIVFCAGNFIVPMINPVIVSKKGGYEAEESCLSLTGVRKTARYENIEVEYFDRKFNKKREKFSGFVAQIIQHEVDHLEGIII